MESRRHLYAVTGTCVLSLVVVAKNGHDLPIMNSEERVQAHAPSIPPPLSCGLVKTRVWALFGATPPTGSTSRGAADVSDPPDASTLPPRLLAGSYPYNSEILRAARTRGRLEAPGESPREGCRPGLLDKRTRRGV